jgi:hypothetical protein
LVLNSSATGDRPIEADWAATAGGPSFPSGHTTAATIFAAFTIWALLSQARTPQQRAVLVGLAVAQASLVGTNLHDMNGAVTPMLDYRTSAVSSPRSRRTGPTAVQGDGIGRAARQSHADRVGSGPSDADPSRRPGTFTIDDHRSRAPHFDLRLTLDDRVSLWAVSSEMPAPGGPSRLAVRIEELPIEGLGETADLSDRTLWDEGQMTVGMWREGHSAVVTLHGAFGGGLGGSRTVSLVHVGSVGQDDDHWSIVALAESW